MSEAKKDTIYIDIDDEITAIIEKVHDSKSKILALVLPKRAAVLQSTVNMRLLKRASEEAKKDIVLITSESAILPLAGAVGIYVAKTLQSKPAIPPAPEIKNQPLVINDDSDNLEKIDPATPIGKLAGDEDEPEETIEVDNDDKAEEDDRKSTEKPVNKKLKVPNFERFRLLILLGGTLLVLLIIGGVWALMIAPKARIIIKTDTSIVSSSLDLTASPNAKTLDTNKLIVPATIVQIQKTDTQQVSATGQKDEGTKSTGTITLYYCPSNNNAQITLSAGSALGNNGSIFRTSADVTVPASNFTGGGVCKKDLSQVANVTADLPGDKYNFSARSYTSVDHSDVSGAGSAMTGGTSKLVKAVSQQDYDAAKQQLLDRTSQAATTDLKKQLSDSDKLALSDSITLGDQSITAAPNIGDVADQTTVTAKLTYSMVGLAQPDLKQLIEADVKQKIDPTTQRILDSDDGLGKASIKLQDRKPNGDIPVNLQVQVSAGSQQDTDAIKKEVAGKKRGDATETIQKRPGVKEVNIQYSPFWVLSTPKKTSKITVVFEQANGSK